MNACGCSFPIQLKTTIRGRLGGGIKPLIPMVRHQTKARRSARIHLLSPVSCLLLNVVGSGTTATVPG